MTIRLAVLMLAGAAGACGAYTYDYVNPYLTYSSSFTRNNGGLSTNGTLWFATTPASNILIPSVSGNANDYEVNTSISLSSGGGTFIHYVRASSNALASSGSCAGSYVSVELAIPSAYAGGTAAGTLAINRCASGSLSSLGSSSVAVPPGSSVLRSIAYGTTLVVYLNSTPIATQTLPATTGQPGVGFYGYTSSTGFGGNVAGMYLSIGHRDTVAPNTVASTGIRSSILPNQVSLQWQGATDDTNGIGVYQYTIARNGTTIGNVTGAEFADSTVSPSTTYTYTISAIDFHGNSGAATTISVTTPPSTAVDPRRVGANVTGSYWGGGGEQIDMLSGNLNYSLPLITAKGRPGWSVPVGLTYNSQNWRQDGGANWQLGEDVGYGYGWKVQIGSITPYYTGSGIGVDHYVFIDGTGAEYRLDQNSGGVWSSRQGIYVWFEASANRLHFKNGMFWYMGCTSGGAEADAGTMYPTVIEDANGNQVIVSYAGSDSLPSGNWNTSSRISSIQDVRGVYSSYGFTYYTTGAIGHLNQIYNYVGTPENYTFTYTTGASLMPPFGTDSAYTGQTTTQLSGITVPAGNPYQFTYDTAGANELLKAQFPWGGYLRWTYLTSAYAGGRSLREISNRYMYSAATTGGTEYGPYPFTHSDTGVSGGIPTVHADTTIVDASGNGAKKWTFNTSGSSAWQIGLVSQFDQKTSASGTLITQDNFTWGQTATSLNPYIATKVSVKDPGTSNAASAQTTQTLDQYGNTTQTVVYPYNNTTTPLATYNSTFVTTSSYLANYLRGLPASSSVTVGSTTTTLVTNAYDSSGFTFSCSGGGSGTPSRQFDPSAPAPWGNLTTSTTLAGSSGTCYLNGVAYSATAVDGTSTSMTVSSASNYTAPDRLSSPSYYNDVTYNGWLGTTQMTGTNGETLYLSYDSQGRPTGATSPYGAGTSYAYSPAGTVPAWQTKTGPDGFTRTTLDGFGRPILVERGPDSSTIVSKADTVYAPCACSPLGKPQKVSQPYAPGSTVYWTQYSYDGIGRTLTAVLPDGASTTTYAYAGSKTTVTDPAGKWKAMVSDVAGNLTSVVEPDPANPTTATFTTTYTYDWMNHLTGTSMTRGSTTQTRTFVFNSAGQMTSATNPESGTVSYAYNSDTTLQSKTDAKGQVAVYSYDTKKRVTMVQRYPYGLSGYWGYGTAEDLCQRVTYQYDGGTYGAGRLSSVGYGAPYTTGTLIQCPGTAAAYSFRDVYSYHPAGAVTGKTFKVYENTGTWNVLTLNANYTYDSAGRTATVSSSGTGARTFTYTYDSMGRPTTLTDDDTANYPGGLIWAQNAQYDAAGRMTRLDTAPTPNIWGSGYLYTTENRIFNPNGQLTSLNWTIPAWWWYSPRGFQYSYSGTQNNGQITQSLDTVSSGETVSYSYDALKRMTAATGTPTSGSSLAAWGQTFQYDGFGNLTSKVLNGGANMAPAVNAATNRLSGGTYDANGNMTSGLGLTMTYDESNRLTSATPTSGGTEYYSYAPDNKRIYRWGANGAEEFMFYGAHGEQLAGSGAAVWFGGRKIANPQSPLLNDRLGTNAFYSHYPYGEGRSASGSGDEFATYYRDGFTTLDYADQRYYASSYGKFNTADPSQKNVELPNPTSWNHYAYVNGDPVNDNDPDGLGFWSNLWGAITGNSSGSTSDSSGTRTVSLPMPDMLCGDCSDGGDGGGGGGGTPTFTTTVCATPGEVWTGSQCDVPIGVNWGFVQPMEGYLGPISVGGTATLRIGELMTGGTLQYGGTFTLDSNSGITFNPSNPIRVPLPNGSGTLSASGTVTTSKPIGPVGSGLFGGTTSVGTSVNYTCGQVGNGLSLSLRGYLNIGVGFYVNLGGCP